VLVVSAAALACPATALAAPPSVGGIQGTNGAEVPELDWRACPAGSSEEGELLAPYRCTTVDVPLSYRDPAGQSIELALGLLPAADPDRKLGTLFWNPGGPGGSGRIPPAFSAALHERFDIVGFDPRGVGESTPLRCFETNEQAFELLAWDFPITLAQERDVVERTRQATELCERNGGPLLEHMSTANVARDLDLLREAVGDDALTYLGFSYGTQLGSVYANLFPEHVRALALDAVLDPVEWTTGYAPRDAFAPFTYRLGSHLGSQDAFTTFLAACATDERCAFREEDVDLRRKYDRLLSAARRRPIEVLDPDGERFTITYQTLVSITIGLLYDPAASAILAETLQVLHLAAERREERPGAMRVRDRDVVLEAPRQRPFTRLQEEEPYVGIEWFSAISCTDTSNPSNPWAWSRYARRADREASPFGAPWVYASLPCATWPGADPDRYTGPWDRPTANPLLLVGNRLGDPATPYEDAARTATEVLADARLLTLDSFGHVAFFQSACVVDAVERYLIDLELPAEGTVCQPDRAPFDPLPELPDEPE
jgi:pimeloyl-ACP methyl ester carboxylesterase